MGIWKGIVLLVLILTVITIDYPHYDQCDERWAYDRLGSGGFYTICMNGSMLTTLAMASPQDFNPSTLNIWLRDHRKYQKILIYLTDLNEIGLSYQST